MRWRLVTILVSLCASLPCGMCGNDYLSAKVAAAISLHRSGSHASLPASLPVVNALKEVRFYSAPWCSYCKAPEAAFAAAQSLPFKLVKLNVDVVGMPANIPKKDQGIPNIQWEDSAGKTIYLEKWAGLPDLIARWEFSQKTKPKPPAKAKVVYGPQNKWPSFAGYRPHWTFPGDLRSHLKTAHGVYEADQLTFSQAAKLHDTMHETGYSAGQIRNYYLSH